MNLKAAQLFLLLVSCECVKIRKCCKQGEYLEEFKCVKNINSTYWIPADSFIIQSSESTVKISKDLVNKTVTSLYKGKFAVGFPKCDDFSRDLAIAWKEPDREDEFYLLSDGGKRVLLNFYRKSVYHDNVTLSFRNTFSPEFYCVDSGIENSFLAVLCPCTEMTCIRKCCHEYSVFDEEQEKCVPKIPDMVKGEFGSHMDWRPKFPEFTSNATQETENKYFLLSGTLPPCAYERGVYIENESGNRSFTFMPNGSVMINSTKPDTTVQIIPAGEHCGEWGWNKTRGTLEPILLRCFPEKQEEDVERVPIYATLLTLSALLLVISACVLVFETDPDLEKRGTKSILGHVSSLAVSHVIGALALTLPVGVDTPECIFSGYVMQWSFLAAFFWLNVMCVDMSWTFSSLQVRGNSRDKDQKKFIWYSIYAWGGPSILTIAALIVEYSGVSEDSPYKPNIGAIKCWFRDSEALWLYFYGPMAILLFTNLILFIYTSFKIIVWKRQTGAIHQADSARHGGRSKNDRQKFILYAKLFSLMGVTWLTEIISWAVGGPKYIWYFTDAINLLRAVFIFIIFCWKPRVWTAIKKRLSCIKKCEVMANKLCCGKVFNIEEDPKTTTTNSSTKDPNSKTDGIEMQTA